MKLAVKIFLIGFVYMSVLFTGLLSLRYSHHQKQMAFAYHKALQVSMLEGSMSVFEDVFYQLAPHSFTYQIKLKGSHEYPRLRRYEVVGTSGQNTIRFDETMIEERYNE